MTQDQWAAGLKAVLKKAATDADFRAKALRDSGAALKEAAGLDLPPGTRVRFVEKLDELTIVLPPLGKTEITDEKALEQVSGGGNIYKYW